MMTLWEPRGRGNTRMIGRRRGRTRTCSRRKGLTGMWKRWRGACGRTSGACACGRGGMARMEEVKRDRIDNQMKSHHLVGGGGRRGGGWVEVMTEQKTRDPAHLKNHSRLPSKMRSHTLFSDTYLPILSCSGCRTRPIAQPLSPPLFWTMRRV